jgi:hypothetical protein
VDLVIVREVEAQRAYRTTRSIRNATHGITTKKHATRERAVRVEGTDARALRRAPRHLPLRHGWQQKRVAARVQFLEAKYVSGPGYEATRQISGYITEESGAKDAEYCSEQGVWRVERRVHGAQTVAARFDEDNAAVDAFAIHGCVLPVAHGEFGEETATRPAVKTGVESFRTRATRRVRGLGEAH